MDGDYDATQKKVIGSVPLRTDETDALVVIATCC